ncbi:MAG TPA: hypothetical protein VKB89_32905 [Xanthobacteraceae bacterium]|nr:hypothetical protein [Xanthobacteraceae bacterium]
MHHLANLFGVVTGPVEVELKAFPNAGIAGREVFGICGEIEQPLSASVLP